MSARIDFDRYRLRRFIERLPPEELEVHREPIDLADLAVPLEGNAKAVLFEAVGPEGVQLCGNVPASRSRLAIAFDTTPQKLLAAVIERLKNPGEYVEVPSDAAPVHEVVLRGEDADLTRLPVHLQHGLDGAPYISASIDVVVDPASGWTNTGVRRLMLRGPFEAGVDLVSPSDLRAIYEGQARRGERVPVAFIVGSHPVDQVAAVMRIPGDELRLFSALRGAPLPVVKCVTNDLRVPADAEYILEGYLDERGHVEKEGP